MRCACIDIGSNTTRVLVADVVDGRLSPVLQRKAFTWLSREPGRITETKLTEIVDVVTAQREAAERAGAGSVRAVATEAVRGCANGRELGEALAARAGVELELLTCSDEARLAFLGATRTLDRPLSGTLAVVDVGGGSSEIALGTLRDGVRWSASYPIGSGTLAATHPCADPPTHAQLDAMRAHVGGVLDSAALPAHVPDHALAVGGSATSLCRLVGPTLAPEALAAALRRLAGSSAEAIAEHDGLEAERVRLLPAGIVVLEAIVRRLGVALRIGRGGLREGVCIETAAELVD